ncbi:hypothetical protein AX15_007421 [Amanita polypyramis BW_CC]|nr:hypothetical protein AX15_007421 [Amanita polypyramis BW_CC]
MVAPISHNLPQDEYPHTGNAVDYSEQFRSKDGSPSMINLGVPAIVKKSKVKVDDKLARRYHPISAMALRKLVEDIGSENVEAARAEIRKREPKALTVQHSGTPVADHSALAADRNMVPSGSQSGNSLRGGGGYMSRGSGTGRSRGAWRSRGGRGRGNRGSYRGGNRPGNRGYRHQPY